MLNDETSTFRDMLSKSNNTNVHVKSIQKLTIEFYKYLHGLLAPLMKGVFTKIVIKYKLQSCRGTFLPNSKTKK